MRAPSPRWVVLGVVVLSAGACLAASLARPAAPVAATGTVEPVVRGVAVCPRPTTHGSTTSALGMVVADADGLTGQAVMSDLRKGTKTFLELDEPGTRAARTVPESDATVPAVMRVEGSIAPVTAAGLVTRTTEGRTRGLSAVACAAPSSESWFVGGGGGVGRRSTLWLANPDTTQAVVDLEVFGPDGVVAGHGTTGIVVPAQRQVGVRLDVVVPGTRRTAVHVLARAGRVSAALQDIDTRGLIPRGADYVPQSSAPSRQLVVPAVLGGSTGSRLLQVAAPGDSDAIVNVKLAAADGTFTPEEGNLLEVPAGSVAALNLAPALKDSGTASVIIDSDVPVIAGVRTVLPASKGAAEVTYSAATPALSGPGSFVPVMAGSNEATGLVLTAPNRDASAVVTIIDPGDAAPKSVTVSVPAGTTVTQRLSGLAGGAAVIVQPGPGSSSLVAALTLVRTDSSGVLRSTVPLASSASTRLVPAVVPDPAIGVPAP